MTTLEVMKRERECVLTQEKKPCDRNCSKCSLVLPINVVLKAYDKVIEMLEVDK